MKIKFCNRFYLLFLCAFLIFPSSCKEEEDLVPPELPDYVYTSVTIGTQVWMVENLKTTMFNDGTAIPLVETADNWRSLESPGYCWYNNDEESNKEVYGALYNNYAIKTELLCPVGWHVPSNAEWNILIEYLGGLYIAGGKLKELGLEHWENPNAGATNESAFTALPGGYRNYEGSFSSIGQSGQWWSSTEDASFRAWQMNLHTDYTTVGKNCVNKRTGFSVRCLKD